MRHVMQYAGALEPNARSKKGVCGSIANMLAAHAYGGCKDVTMNKHMLLKMWTHREVNDTNYREFPLPRTSFHSRSYQLYHMPSPKTQPKGLIEWLSFYNLWYLAGERCSLYAVNFRNIYELVLLCWQRATG